MSGICFIFPYIYWECRIIFFGEVGLNHQPDINHSYPPYITINHYKSPLITINHHLSPQEDFEDGVQWTRGTSSGTTGTTGSFALGQDSEASWDGNRLRGKTGRGLEKETYGNL